MLNIYRKNNLRRQLNYTKRISLIIDFEFIKKKKILLPSLRPAAVILITQLHHNYAY